MLVYKILLPGEWDEFQAAGRFDGTAYDRSCGFIHCSSRDQVGATAQRVFGQERDLVVVALDAQLVGDPLRWEPARNGDPFPHVYAPLPVSAVVGVYRVADAAHVDDALPPE